MRSPPSATPRPRPRPRLVEGAGREDAAQVGAGRLRCQTPGTKVPPSPNWVSRGEHRRESVQHTSHEAAAAISDLLRAARRAIFSCAASARWLCRGIRLFSWTDQNCRRVVPFASTSPASGRSDAARRRGCTLPAGDTALRAGEDALRRGMLITKRPLWRVSGWRSRASPS